MKITLIGAGAGPETLIAASRLALRDAQAVVGAKRLLTALSELIPPGCACAALTASDRIAEYLSNSACERACVLLSGDTGFYSGTRRLVSLLEDQDLQVLPGISSVQLLAARLQRPWQDWLLCSAHGVSFDVLAAVSSGKPVFLLTSGSAAPGEICRELADAGLGSLTVTVAESLGSAEERLVSATADALKNASFSALNVMLLEAAPSVPRRAPGLPDDTFVRAERVPMTKQEIRAAVLSKLAVSAEDVCWDIGAGTGSVSVELAHHARAVYAVERSEEALRVAQQNRDRLCAWNLRLICGEAPEALSGLPAPDKMFVGGTGGHLSDVLRAVHAANPHARVCVSAIAIETLSHAVLELEALGYQTEITQIMVSRSREAGSLHLMLAQNPVYLIVGCAP